MANLWTGWVASVVWLLSHLYFLVVNEWTWMNEWNISLSTHSTTTQRLFVWIERIKLTLFVGSLCCCSSTGTLLDDQTVIDVEMVIFYLPKWMKCDAVLVVLLCSNLLFYYYTLQDTTRYCVVLVVMYEICFSLFVRCRRCFTTAQYYVVPFVSVYYCARAFQISINANGSDGPGRCRSEMEGDDEVTRDWHKHTKENCHTHIRPRTISILHRSSSGCGCGDNSAVRVCSCACEKCVGCIQNDADNCRYFYVLFVIVGLFGVHVLFHPRMAKVNRLTAAAQPKITIHRIQWNRVLWCVSTTCTCVCGGSFNHTRTDDVMRVGTITNCFLFGC